MMGRTVSLAQARPVARASADEVSATRRRLTRGYVLGLSLIAILTIAGGWNVTRLLEQQAQHASIINISGAQRMLSQRIAALAPLAADAGAAGEAAARRELANAAQRMAASHARLLEAAQHPETGSRALREHYLLRGLRDGRPLDLQVRSFLGMVENIVEARDSGVTSPGIQAIALHDLLPELHHAVALHEEVARERIEVVLRWHFAMMAAALILLLLEAAFIFRPLVRQTADLTTRLRQEADTDPLTGALNRRAITRALGAALAKGAPFAVLAIDLDHFKEANDAEGHEAGDALLRVAVQRLRNGIRPDDAIGRVGGDEFVVLLRGVAETGQAQDIAQRLSHALHLPVSHQGRVLKLGATLGIALSDLSEGDPLRLLRAADEALMQAKRKARGSIGFARNDDTQRLARETALLRTLREDEGDVLEGLAAHLQPIIRLADGEVAGVEALARFDAPGLGPVPPDELFRLAERTGEVHRISRMARGHAFAAYAALRREGLLGGRLAVNLSAAELLKPSVVDDLERQCEAFALDLGALTIEIREDVLLERIAPQTVGRLATLRGKGAWLALDDFGTGTSGLAQLLRLPLDELKLDRRFIANLGLDGRAERIVEGTVRLASSMGMRVVAEGIEEEAQARLARDIGCDLGQGWLFACPMPAAALREWLATRRANPSVVVPFHRAPTAVGPAA